MELHDALFCEASPAPTKYAASLLGLCEEEVRLPIVPMTGKGRETRPLGDGDRRSCSTADHGQEEDDDQKMSPTTARRATFTLLNRRSRRA
jgi:hypothetical protein